MKRYLFSTLLILMIGNSLAGHRLSAQAIQPLSSDSFITVHQGLPFVHQRIRHQQAVKVAFLGGSITNMQGWRDLVSTYLQTHWPQSAFTFLNAGIPSLGSLPHSFRLQQDVLSQGKIDLLFIESAVNDKVNATDSLVQRRALEGIIRHARRINPQIDIVLMAFVDEDKMNDYRHGITPAEVALHARLADCYQLPFINLAAEVTRRIDNREFSWEKDFKDLHPAPFGHRLYANTIDRLLQRCLDSTIASSAQRALPPPLDKAAYTYANYEPLQKATALQGFRFTPAWQPVNGVNTRPGFVNVPVLETDSAGASLQFHFTGNAVGIAIIAGPDAGIISYSIDGQPARTADTYTRWSKALHLPWYLLLADNLPTGLHTLSLAVTNNKNTQSKGYACRIVHFLANR
ncbi:hypothetical protein KTO58_05985 [Chitinophaga pendula]|uniref:SGNH/GDSL hydrolase family protein n=1 Tax=Chitinophaga TaxID=79328 RepID=UPI000BAE9248|nr:MULTISPECIES: GDSL-type esterase/lipase family protein [Chitinophaga]ASZ13638.1 hypothetical protein CK934_23135 [Chitinophaga sp. MD30]UCJ08737.1 hypothetical protein KTO58_05985 [Chitinophaga pendula]